MFLVVASVSEASEGNSSFKLFDITVDGEYFCSVRYSQLHQLYTQLRKAFPSVTSVLPDFPPKKLGTLSRHQLEQRRLGIEIYLQKFANTPQLSGSPVFKNFFLAAQFASWNGTADPVTLTVHLLGRETVDLPGVSALEREELVKERFARKLGLRGNLMEYFTFHVAVQEEDGSLSILRQLYSMESPVITLYRGGPKRRLVFARKFWHMSIHKEVYENEAGRDILFLEAVQSVEKGLWKCREVDKEKLRMASLQKKKHEFLDLMAQQEDYLSTVIRGLTVYLSSVRCDGFVTVKREALQVSYRVGGGEGVDNHGYKVIVMNWTQIMRWSLLHQGGRPVLHILYKGPGPLTGRVFFRGQPVAYLAQCLEAVIVMAKRLKEAARKPVDEIPEFPKVIRTGTIWPPTSQASSRPSQTAPPPQRGQQQLEQGRHTQQWQQQQHQWQPQQQQWQSQQQQSRQQQQQPQWRPQPLSPQQLPLQQPPPQQPLTYALQQHRQWQPQQQLPLQPQQQPQQQPPLQPPLQQPQQRPPQEPPQQEPPPQEPPAQEPPPQEPPPQEPPLHDPPPQEPPQQEPPPQERPPQEPPQQEPPPQALPPQEPPPQDPPPQEPPPQEPPLQEPPPQELPPQNPPPQEPPPNVLSLHEPPPQEPLPQEPLSQEPPPQEPSPQEPPPQEPPPQEPPPQEPLPQEPPPQESPPQESPPHEPPPQEPSPQEPPPQEPPPQEPLPQEPLSQEPPPQEPPPQEPPPQEPPPQEPPPQEPSPQEPPPQEPPPQEPPQQEPSPQQQQQREERSWVASTSSRRQRTQSL